ncbi:MAG: hypothetical protein KIH62_000140, partial [Candidatus Kerfeldbacteria bacterium]|nr:hypothetical protein [Candidatus Kerfeldbacteria bacterium]
TIHNDYTWDLGATHPWKWCMKCCEGLDYGTSVISKTYNMIKYDTHNANGLTFKVEPRMLPGRLGDMYL